MQYVHTKVHAQMLDLYCGTLRTGVFDATISTVDHEALLNQFRPKFRASKSLEWGDMVSPNNLCWDRGAGSVRSAKDWGGPSKRSRADREDGARQI